MPEGRFKSRSFKRIKKKLPGGSTVIHYRRKNSAKAQCAGCGKFLNGVPRGKAADIKALPRSQRRPERPFGGVLCTECAREKIKAKARE